MPKTVIFDIDDVLIPWAATVHKACIEAGIAPSDSTWSKWEMWEDWPNGNKQDWLRVVDSLVMPDGLYHQPPYPGATQAIHKLRSLGHDVHFVTARGFFAHADEIRQWTKEWVQKYFPTLPPHKLWFAQDKGVVAKIINATHAIDDRFDNVLVLDKAGVKAYIMTQPHNAHIEIGQRRVSDVPEFVERVLND